MSSTFCSFYNIFWNSSNGIYDNLSSFGISISGSPGMASSNACPIGVSRCLYQPFFNGASSYTQLTHNTLKFSNFVFIGFLSKKSRINGGNLSCESIWVKSALQLSHRHAIYPSRIPLVNKVSSLYGLSLIHI